MDWQARFGQALGLKVLQLTGDDDTDGLDEMEAADIICSTPEKFGEGAGLGSGRGWVGGAAALLHPAPILLVGLSCCCRACTLLAGQPVHVLPGVVVMQIK